MPSIILSLTLATMTDVGTTTFSAQTRPANFNVVVSSIKEIPGQRGTYKDMQKGVGARMH